MKWIKPLLQVLALLSLGYLLWSVHCIRRDLEKIKSLHVEEVTVTTYTTDPKQTDSSPFVTASGFRLNRKNPKKHRIIAVSRDLQSSFKFGDRVKLIGAGELSGIYTVHDVMNKRFRNRVDVLINPKDNHTMYKGVKIVKI